MNIARHVPCWTNTDTLDYESWHQPQDQNTRDDSDSIVALPGVLPNGGYQSDSAASYTVPVVSATYGTSQIGGQIPNVFGER
jgi:hypothetical protein